MRPSAWEMPPHRRRCPSLVGDPAAEEWSPWSVCSLTCGQGLQVRTRSCVSSPYGTLCSGPLRETRPCNNSATCPGMPVFPPGLPAGLGPAWDLGRLILQRWLVASSSHSANFAVPHAMPSPTRDTDESDQGPQQWARLWACHSCDACALVIKAHLPTLTALWSHQHLALSPPPCI